MAKGLIVNPIIRAEDDPRHVPYRLNRIEPLDEAAKLLTELHGAWSEVSALATPLWEKNQAAARSMSHTSGPSEAIRMQMRG